MSNNTFGVRLKLLRKTLKLTQEAFAVALGIDRGHVGNMENDSRQPSESLIKHISLRFSVSESWLKIGAGEMFLSPDDALKSLMARFGEQAIVEVFRRIISNETEEKIASADIIDAANFTRRISDKEPELRRMVNSLYTIFSTNDERLKSWTSFQFDRAIPADVIEEAQKKQQGTTQQSSAG